MRTGYNSLCPFHGKPLPEVARPAPPTAAPVVLIPICGDCELRHAPDIRCEFVDET